MRLLDWPLPEIRLACNSCSHEMTFETEGLKALFGDEEKLWKVRERLLTGCIKGRPASECMTVYADALLVDAILEYDEEKVVEKSLLPQAREWRQKLGIGNQFSNGRAA